jgi:hypothetical protein
MSTRMQDAHHRPLSKVDRLRQDAQGAAELRALTTHPDVIALRVEAVRAQVDALIWIGIVLGLGFTMVNVQTFAAAGAVVWSLPWLAAWFLDPMVSLVLIAVLRAEQVTARYQVETGAWVRRTKVFAFAATYAMNTWQSWVAGHVAGIVLHSVPPTMVYLAAETGPILRDRLTEAVLRAAHLTGTGAAATPAAVVVDGTATVNTPLPVQDSVGERPARRVRERPPAPRTATPKPARKLLADYLAEARAAWTPGVVVTPAWVRSVTACARGTSKNVADALNRELDTSSVEVAA